MSPAVNLERVLTKKELAEFLSIHPRTIDYWISQGQVPHYKLGKSVRFKLSDISVFMESKKKGGLQ